VRITDIIWKDRYVEKLASKHSVAVGDAEEVLFSTPLVRKVATGHVRGEDIYAAMAQISSGRYLIVFFISKKHDMALPISARDMDTSEREYYGKHK
jgi:uncharacterized DUF497 family protein